MTLTVRRKPGISLGIAALVLACVPSVTAASSLQLAGSIGGQIRNSTGVSQMGATVVLYNRYDRVIRQVLSKPDGSFVFDSLLPDLYSVRVSLSNFIPAFKRNIGVRPGFQSMLTINMAGMFSSIEFVAATPAQGALMSDDWKWVLRSSQATRPVLRFRDPGLDVAESRPRMSNVFSETRGIVKVSAGDATSFAGSGAQADLGTAFALTTSLFDSNQFEFSGNFGYSAHTGLPTAGFRTKYTRADGAAKTPEITVSMHQINLPAHGWFAAAGTDMPSLRTLSATMLDEFAVTDTLRMEYGATAESVSLLNRLNMLSPFARLTLDLGTHGSVQIAYSSSATATELAAHGSDQTTREDAALNLDLSALGTLPRVSMRDGQAQSQRTENIEVGYTKVAGSRTFSAGAFHERVSNGALTLAGSGDLFAGDVLPDLGSQSAVFNIGKFNRWGYLASATQSLGDHVDVSMSYGRGGALTTEGRELRSEDVEELRRMVRVHQRNWASARIAATAPRAGTRLIASYGWADYRSLMPAHLFLAQRFSPEPGLNIYIRQPLPSVGGVPGRFEASAELRNMLEQGYLPITSVDGRSMLLTNAPRALRGGLSFIF
jgi:hypothetical protein